MPRSTVAEPLGAGTLLPHLIIKSHGPDSVLTALINKGATPCICTYRKPEDAIVSWMNTFGVALDDATRDLFRAWMIWHRALVFPVLNIDYEHIERRPLQAIHQIQKYLLGKIDAKEALRLRAKYDKARLKKQYEQLPESSNTQNIGFSYYDKETFFHRRHISSLDEIAAVNALAPGQVAHIRQEFGDLVDKNGNYIVPNVAPEPKGTIRKNAKLKAGYEDAQKLAQAYSGQERVLSEQLRVSQQATLNAAQALAAREQELGEQLHASRQETLKNSQALAARERELGAKIQTGEEEVQKLGEQLRVSRQETVHGCADARGARAGAWFEDSGK